MYLIQSLICPLQDVTSITELLAMTLVLSYLIQSSTYRSMISFHIRNLKAFHLSSVL